MQRWYRAARRILIGEDGRPLYFAVLQDTTSEHAARERADRSVRELDDWFDLSPVGMVLFDDSGLLVRTNPAFDQMAGSVPVSLAEGDPGLALRVAVRPGGCSVRERRRRDRRRRSGRCVAQHRDVGLGGSSLA